MQLTIEVLPAPLGPMIENSSPSFTPKLTSVSARTPPKRSDTARTSKAYATHFLRRFVSEQRFTRGRNILVFKALPALLSLGRQSFRGTKPLSLGCSTN